MRKQTKLVAVLSTAALLAVGASMTSFAATGWQEENGTWVYYSKSGDKETEKWEKSGDNWFYLNEDGEMATDLIVEYSDNYYYVDENGAMVTNKWVSVENTEYDGTDDEPVNYWYYFGANGKAYKTSSNASNAVFKSINGKNYIFNDEGKMLYGWIGADGERKTSDDAWEAGNGVYYCGTENDGAQTVGWLSLDIVDPNHENTDKDGYSSKNVFDDENQTRWFYFKSNGKKLADKKGETINGKKYSFDEHGRMNAEWVFYGSPSVPTDSKAGQGTPSYSSNFRYYGSPEDGARVTKGWFQVVADENLNKGNYDDSSDAWYYSNKDGNLVASKIETINGKKYAFDEYGRMRAGMRFIKFETGSTTKIAKIYADDNDDYPFDTEDNFKENANKLLKKGYSCYYFGSGSDGSMKTNKQAVSIDGDSFNFFFNKSGSLKGAGKNGEDSSKYYSSGMLMAADKDDKYAVVKIENAVDEAGKAVKLYSVLTTDDFIKAYTTEKPDFNKDKYTEYYVVDSTKIPEGVEFKLVNTSGSVQKNKSKAKDGSSRCYKQSGEKITEIFVED